MGTPLNSLDMKAVILSAGLGKRLGGKIKPLVKVGGREILYRNLKNLSRFGIDEFIIVVNQRNRWAIEDFLKRHRFKYKIVENKNPERGNGYSLYLARDFVDGKFVLVMGDHIYSEDFVKEAIKGEGLIGDRIARYIDIKEATKVMARNGRVCRIGKDLEKWDFIDTGFFILDPDIFKHAESLVKEKYEVSLSEIVERAGVRVTDVSGFFWIDVDTKDDLKRANKLIVRMSFKGYGDGFVSRYINRKISLRISEMLVNRITPNQATVMSFLIGISSSLLIPISIPIAGIIYQISSILDGIDGEIARASMRITRFGGWLDSVLDRYVDFLFLLILAAFGDLNLIGWIFACLAIFGSFMVSYTTERYRGAFMSDFYRDFRFNFPGKRDERIFLIMLFCLLGHVFELFVLLAFLTNLRVILTIYTVSKYKRGV